jgi:transcription termination factor NusB
MRAQKESFDTRDYTMFRKAYKEVTTTFEPIVKIVEEKEKELDKKIEKVLTTKELKKWVKYKKNIKKR